MFVVLNDVWFDVVVYFVGIVGCGGIVVGVCICVVFCEVFVVVFVGVG